MLIYIIAIAIVIIIIVYYYYYLASTLIIKVDIVLKCFKSDSDHKQSLQHEALYN